MRYSSYRTRSYYSGYFPPAVKWLLIVNTAVFVIQYLAIVLVGIDPFPAMGLVPGQVLYSGWIWQLFTYMFLHGGFFHVGFNMLALWFFGPDLERDWGTKQFLKYYLLCGVAAGVCVVLVTWLLRPAELLLRTIGASGAIYGVLLAYGVLYSDRIILMMFLFPMKVKYAVMIFGAVAFLSSFQPAAGVSHVAHLGGMIFGYIYLKMGIRRFRTNPAEWVRSRIHEWRLQRARRKFQVYMKKQQSDRDRWVH